MDYQPTTACSGWEDFPLNEINKDDSLILMQFTGLLDKNSVEIYEGDIVKAPDGVWEVQIRDLEDGVCLINDAKETGSLDYIDGEYSLTECEVIGNIYENPELLTQ